ncbi:MAG: HAD-IA family hydrolase [Propioniciclava sp.]|uniref:HAD family hydrolase n=1 Tax=Propioniciclava sp. TaxID=2038686 RepID=UPI0039E21FF4
MIRAVVFDLGHTLASGEGVISEPARLLDVDEERFAALYPVGRDAYDRGESDASYWGPILTALDRPATPENIARLAQLDASLWLRLRPTARRLLGEVREAGRTIAILSNAPFSIDMALLDADYANEADYWFVSASMGVAKPDLAAYDRVTEVLELDPAEIAFLDDLEVNVEAARRVGWQAAVWTSDADSRGWLISLGVLDD